jgi:prephenate dehydrogenase
MSNFTITIVGAGVIGASMGLALKQSKEPPRIISHDKDLAIANAGVKLDAFDKAEWNLVNACEQADLVILTIPLNGIRLTLEAIGPYLKQGAVISDTTPNKAQVLAMAAELLPPHVHYVGGNPIVLPAGSGQEHAAANLFRDKLYCLTPAPAAAETAVQTMVGLVSLLGAEPFFLDAAEHDGLTAAVDALPALVSTSLVNTLAGQGSWRELRKVAGGMFEQVSAGASGNPDALKDSWLAHRAGLAHWLEIYIDQLTRIQALLAAADNPSGEALADLIDKAVVARRDWRADSQQGRLVDPGFQSPPLEKTSFMKQLLGFRR